MSRQAELLFNGICFSFSAYFVPGDEILSSAGLVLKGEEKLNEVHFVHGYMVSCTQFYFLYHKHSFHKKLQCQ